MPSDEADAGVDDIDRRITKPPHDAGVPMADAGRPVSDASVPPADAGPVTGTGGGGTTGSGTVSCYASYSPKATCAIPSTHCCFSNYSSDHDGSCSSAATACTWGSIDCDGPEDCATGQHCCAHAIIDPDNGLTGYKLGCQASACGAAPVDEELCHPASTAAGNTCGAGKTCVSANDWDYDLPGTLFICH